MRGRLPLERLHRLLVRLSRRSRGPDPHELFRDWVGAAPDLPTRRRRARRAVSDAAWTALRAWAERVGAALSGLGQHGLEGTRHAARTLRRRPLESVTVIATLAICVGANAALVEAARTLLLRALPYEDAEAIVQVRGASVTAFQADGRFGVRPSFTGAPGVEAASFYTPDGSATLHGTRNRRVATAHVAENFFEVMGVRLALGGGLRGAEPDERVAVLGHSVWRTDFGADPGVLGRDVILNGIAYRVVGVTPPEVQFPGETEIWLSYPVEFEFVGGAYGADVVGRLRPGADPAAVAAHLEGALADQRRAYAEAGREAPPIEVVSLRSNLVRSVRTPVLVLLGAAGLVLLLGVLNLASVWVGRVIERDGEFRTRRALGASRPRLTAQVVSEAAALSALGGLAALAVAWVGTQMLARRLPATIPGVRELGLSPATILAAVAGATLVGALIGLGIALRVRTVGVGGSRAGSTRGRLAAERAVVLAQGAAATVLLAGSLLTVASLRTLVRAPLGFEPDGALSFTVRVPAAEADGGPALVAYAEAVEARLRDLPAVDDVGWTSRLPLAEGMHAGARFKRPDAPDSAAISSTALSASETFFEAAGVPLLRGQPLAGEVADDELVIDEHFARAVFASLDVVGAEVLAVEGYTPAREPIWAPRRVRGVVGGVRRDGARGNERPTHYLPPSRWPSRELGFVLRVRGNPAALGPAVDAAVREVNPRVVPTEVRTLRERADALLATDRTLAQVISVFAAVALLLVALGLYGSTARYVAARRHELGVRLALGAAPARLRSRLVGHAVLLGLAAAAVGIPLALLGAPLLEERLAGVAVDDPLRLLATAGLVVGVTALAAWVPARRILSIAPTEAMRAE